MINFLINVLAYMRLNNIEILTYNLFNFIYIFLNYMGICSHFTYSLGISLVKFQIILATLIQLQNINLQINLSDIFLPTLKYISYFILNSDCIILRKNESILILLSRMQRNKYIFLIFQDLKTKMPCYQVLILDVKDYLFIILEYLILFTKRNQKY
ncbi:unnamed protein product [Paramecium sonneborni]|uniref:Transmembrane protein n=1 Tax=Paramecium sonneborni TaxID=65129 RepID=A0A8S1K894_9CILI|nr:unnamed protein product [Paramecium sonneborni]